jgi:hypothetical protein
MTLSFKTWLPPLTVVPQNDVLAWRSGQRAGIWPTIWQSDLEIVFLPVRNCFRFWEKTFIGHFGHCCVPAQMRSDMRCEDSWTRSCGIGVTIVGCGLGGLFAAKNVHGADVDVRDVTPIDRTNHHCRHGWCAATSRTTFDHRDRRELVVLRSPGVRAMRRE